MDGEPDGVGIPAPDGVGLGLSNTGSEGVGSGVDRGGDGTGGLEGSKFGGVGIGSVGRGGRLGEASGRAGADGGGNGSGGNRCGPPPASTGIVARRHTVSAIPPPTNPDQTKRLRARKAFTFPFA